MLHEVENARQIEGEPFRRWFTSSAFDLYVWVSDEKDIVGFQLCYRLDARHLALTWLQDKGYTHRGIDDGEGRPLQQKMSPVLVPDGAFPAERVLSLFEEKSKELDPEVAGFVTRKLHKYAGP